MAATRGRKSGAAHGTPNIAPRYGADHANFRKIWISDGEASRFWPRDEPIPKGWHRGMAKRPKRTDA